MHRPESQVFSGFIADAVSKREEELYESMRKQTTGATATGARALVLRAATTARTPHERCTVLCACSGPS